MRLFALAASTLWQRELVRFFRQRSRVIGALAPPILFWFIIGSGLGSSFSGMNYLQYFFPGTVILIVLFTAIFSTISVIEDRHAGFLQSVLVAPLSRLTLVLGKILGGATLAFIQAGLFLLLAGTAGVEIPLSAWPMILVNLLLLSFGLTGLGFVLAWWLDSTQGFHAIMNLFLIPLWLLSGALFPSSGAAGWMRVIMQLNPVSYSLSCLQRHMFVDGRPLTPGIASDATGLLVTAAFAVAMFCVSVWAVKKR